jgi:hypothetical protein
MTSIRGKIRGSQSKSSGEVYDLGQVREGEGPSCEDSRSAPEIAFLGEGGAAYPHHERVLQILRHDR